LHTIISADITYYTVDWPENTDNPGTGSRSETDSKYQIIETKLVNRTVQRMFNSYGISNNKEIFRYIHAYETFTEFVINFMNYLWQNPIRVSYFDTSFYPDYLIRSSLIHPPGIGIGYLCLK